MQMESFLYRRRNEAFYENCLVRVGNERVYEEQVITKQCHKCANEFILLMLFLLSPAETEVPF